MKRSPAPRAAFTLIEMLTVMLVIAILASLVLAVNGLVQNKAARARAQGEIQTISLGCENYKADNGTFPQSEDTNALNPREHGNPITGGGATLYQKASLSLYSALSGDTDPAGAPDFKPEGKSYLPEFFKPNVLGGTKNADGKLIGVKYIQDPFGNSYGYSTIAAKAEQDFQLLLRTNPAATRDDKAGGFNPTFDLWSTGGGIASSASEIDKQQGKWVKNW